MKLVLFAGLVLYFSTILHWFLVDKFALSKSFRIKIISVFLTLSIWGSLFGALVLGFKFSPAIVLVSAVLMAVLFFILKKSTSPSVYDIRPEIDDESKAVVEEWPTPFWSAAAVFALLVYGFYVLSKNTSAISLLSPWQAIDPAYIILFFITTLLLGCLIFTRFTAGTILGLLVLHAFLLHSYLPLSSQLFFGADGWRHIAIDNQLWNDTPNGTLISAAQLLGFWQNFNFGSLAYAQFSGLALLFRYFTGLQFIDFIRYFIPFVWSLVLPIVLFEIGRALNFSKKNALLLVWLSSLPFALQVSGSFSLPSNLGFLIFICLLLLVLKTDFKTTWQLPIFLSLSLLFIFGYSLYFFLFWIFFSLAVIRKKVTVRWPSFLAAFVFSFSLPAIELLTRFSAINPELSYLRALKNIAVNFLSLIPAFGFLSHDTLSGNIIFNQPPVSAVFENPFLVFSHGAFLFMLCFWGFVLYGSLKILKEKNDNQVLIFQFLYSMLGSYLISRYFLSGENIFTRRMDALLAFLFIIILAYAVFIFLIPNDKKANKLKIFVTILIFSAFISVSYTLGPDSQSASKDQYVAMQNVWNRIKDDTAPKCVLADQFSLLVLEAHSGKQIVGGGFPINSYFAQPEYQDIFRQSFSDPMTAINNAKQLLKTDSCYLVGEYDLPDPLAKINNINIYKF